VPKEQILAGYLNVVEFSGSVYGVAAAAHAYFGTTPDKLTGRRPRCWPGW
jgi:membrane peptidoglycan carboxypeptidase